jgi:hypothetical protein
MTAPTRVTREERALSLLSKDERNGDGIEMPELDEAQQRALPLS